MKPIKRGFKVWVRADSSNGFISDLDGRSGGRPLPSQLLSLSVDSLLVDGMYACGTFQKDRRGVPREIKTVKPGQKSITPG